MAKIFNDYAAIVASQLICLGCIPCDINNVVYKPDDDLSDLRTISILIAGEQPRRMIATIDFTIGQQWRVFRYGENNKNTVTAILNQLVEWNRGCQYTIEMMDDQERKEFVRC